MKAPFRSPLWSHWAVTLFALAVLIASLGIERVFKLTNLPHGDFFLPPIPIERYPKIDVIGDLGGVPISIPKGEARLVEYDGDPGWGEKPLNPAPKRTHQSKLRSFGLTINVDQLAASTTSRPQLEERRAADLNPVDLSLSSGKHYPGDKFLDRMTYTLIVRKDAHLLRKFKEGKSSYPGLKAYVAEEINPERLHPSARGLGVDEYFIARINSSETFAFIRCTNHPRSSTCRHFWSLEKVGMSVVVSASYKREALKHWKEIQEGGTRKILSYRKFDHQAINSKHPSARQETSK